jgi:hypothetical protein
MTAVWNQFHTLRRLFVRDHLQYKHCFNIHCNKIPLFVKIRPVLWAGLLSRYNDWVRAGRSGDRISVRGGDRKDFPHLSRPALGHTQLPVQYVPGKERPGRDADSSTTDRVVDKEEKSYTSNTPMGRTACTEPQCLYSTAIPLLPLLAVQPVQSLSACTVQLHLYSPYGPYCLYRASVPVQYSYTSTPSIGRTACTEPQCL